MTYYFEKYKKDGERTSKNDCCQLYYKRQLSELLQFSFIKHD